MSGNDTETATASELVKRAWSPLLASVLSLVLPGAGQVYKRQIFFGLIWLISAVLAYAGFFDLFRGLFDFRPTPRRYLSPFELGGVIHLLCVADAALSDPQSEAQQAMASTEQQDELERAAGLARAEERGERLGRTAAQAVFKLRKMLRMWI
ncbi:MAG: hypothetical protein ABMA15_10410 [Vicinamibacterales bacterium]